MEYTLDEQARYDFKKNPASCIAWVVKASYCYYKRDESILSDTTFDKMCKYIKDNWDTLEHAHAKLLMTKDQMVAGSMFDMMEYPEWVIRLGEDHIKQVNTARNTEKPVGIIYI